MSAHYTGYIYPQDRLESKNTWILLFLDICGLYNIVREKT